jgi:hypothetical protein
MDDPDIAELAMQLQRNRRARWEPVIRVAKVDGIGILALLARFVRDKLTCDVFMDGERPEAVPLPLLRAKV